MKIQELAIIFIIIILPISLLLSEYTQFQIQTLTLQSSYDAKLTAATYDAIKAFQLNAQNETYSDLAAQEAEDLPASIKTFRNSIRSAFNLTGYTETELDNYIPALVYTLYDGFYIYSPYTNVNYRYKDSTTGESITDTTQLSGIKADGNGENLYGIKPYINYSCRYIKGNIDVVITYALDNYITVRGLIDDKYVNKSGYLIDEIEVDEATGKVTYNNEIRIKSEMLQEYLPIPKAETNAIPIAYPYAKVNGAKYYRADLKTDVLGDDSIISISNGNIVIQCQKSNVPEGVEPDQGTKDYESYDLLISYNNQAVQYYKKAAEFTKWIRNESGLANLKYSDAVNENGEQIWGNNHTKIFIDLSNNIENELSNFNQHRLAVIRNEIETNLAIAISNYNSYSGAATNNVFQMPELKEDEWNHIINNISLISFLQGLPIGGKIYNGYSIVTNAESEEVVLEENIYILGNDGNYHRIGDKYLENEGAISAGNYGTTNSAGRINLDFERTTISDNVQNVYYYPLRDYNASYNSIVMQNDITTYDDIYAYVNSQNNELKIAFYTALGRERANKYNSNIIINTENMQGNKYKITYAANGGNGEAPNSQTKIEGIDVEISNKGTLTRDGYKFNGWSTNPNSHGQDYDYKAGDMYENDESVTLYAVWAKKYTVNYNANGGTGAPATQIKYEGEPLKLDEQKPTREGYIFSGWNGNGTKYESGGLYNVDADVELVAIWNPIIYAVIYNPNGGTGGPEPQNVAYEQTIQIPTQTPTRAKYRFVGWNTSPSATTAQYKPGDNYVVKGNATLYAVWEVIRYTITYNANAGTDVVEGIPESLQLIEGENTQISTKQLTRIGYNFKGWSTSSSATTGQYQPGNTYPQTGGITSNVTLYAIWESKIKVAEIGSYVEYTANGYSSWRIMYNNNGQLDIVSTGSVADYTLTGNGGYINSVLYLNNFASHYVTGLATSARSIGCTSSTQSTISGQDWNMSGNPYQDSYYDRDVNQLRNYGLVQTDEEVWLASRKIESIVLGKKGQVRTLLTNGQLDYWTLQEYYLWGWMNDRSQTKGFRPVVSFPSDLKIVGGDGTQANPYKLSK